MPQEAAVFTGINQWGSDKSNRLNIGVGYNDNEVLDASSGNAQSVMQNGRGITCDVTGVVRVAYADDSGNLRVEVMTLNAGVIRPVRNVLVLYRYYTGTTLGTAQSYNAAGQLITNAVKIVR